MIRLLVKTIPLIAALLLIGCGSIAPTENDREGRVLLWHQWSGADEEALNELLGMFNNVYPEITVISISFPPDGLKDSFIDAATRGLGPDIMIGSQLWTPELADGQLIRPVNENQFNRESYLAPALNTLRYQNELYGLPLAIETSALYYNKELTDEPPETLNELLEQAVEGQKVAINTNFETAFWGIQAFGGRLLDDDGRVVLNQGGFANWLDWLLEVGNVPNVILSKDEVILNDLFAQGEVTYYVGQSSELLELQEILGEEVVGVSPLPAGPNDSAGPFLITEPIFFSRDSSPAQTERAMLLIEFLGNVEQQRRLAQRTGRIPVNPQARINRRISPAVAGFVEQSKTANPLLLLPQIFDVIELGEEIFLHALEGLIASSDAANEITKAVNDTYGLETVAVTPVALCNAIGDIEVWHAWPEPEAAALEQIGHQYSENCPRVKITFTAVEQDDLFRRYRQALQNGQGPDLLLISGEYTTRLASAELVSNLSDQIHPDFLQHYIPNVPEAMRFEGNLFGLPIIVDTMALYYNGLLVKDPPVDLGDLMSQIGPDQSFALPYTPFRAAHWGLTAFGGRLFDVNGSLDITSGGFGEWLNWLQKASDQPGLILTRNQAEAQELFSQGQAAYFVGEQSQLNELQEQLGENLVRVAPLPAGPEGPSGPILDVQGFMVNPGSPVAKAAIEFAKYAASSESQAFLMHEGNLAPAHGNVADPAAFPAISGFLDQTKTAVVVPNHAETDTVFGLGDIIYESVLEDGNDPNAVLEGFTSFFEQVYGVGEEEVVQICDWAGQLILWHSLEGNELSVLDQNIADYGRYCPDVQVEAMFVPAEELPGQLAAASSAGAPPDLFLAPHDLIAPLSAERLIKPITPWLTESTLIPYLSEATDAMRHSEVQYGLPQSLDTTVLYYNTDLVNEPEQQLFDLFASATNSTPLALDTSFDNAFWGATIFGGELLPLGEEERNESLDIRRSSLANWLGWLQSNKDHTGVVMNDDTEELAEIFSSGNVAYLISGSGLLPQLRAELDRNGGKPTKIGVTRLPVGRIGQNSPFLTVNGYLFSAAVSEEQTQMALDFAKVVTSGEAQGLLMQVASRAPANVLALTLVDDSALSAVVDQARTSVLMPPRSENLVLKEGGEILYQSVLEDERAPSPAMADFYAFIEETPRLLIVVYSGEMAAECEEDGRLLLWHSWPFAAATAESNSSADGQQAGSTNTLERIIFDFNELCPGIIVDTDFIPAEDLPARLESAAGEGSVPDLFLAPHDLVVPLARSGAIKPITAFVDQEFLDQYLDKSIEALQFGEKLYGVPQTVDVAALYYNSSAANSAVSTLDELLANASLEAQVAIDTSFHKAHWGIGDFGGSIFDADGKILGDQSAFIDWLSWLKDAQGKPGMVLNNDQADLQQRFVDGEFAYLVTGASSLTPLRGGLGENVQVALLPAGKIGQPSPLLTVDSFLFDARVSEKQTDLALKFAQFAASEENQLLLAQEANLIPTNHSAVDSLKDPQISIFAKQAADMGVLLAPDIPIEVLEAGESVYTLVFDGDLNPELAVAELVRFTGED